MGRTHTKSRLGCKGCKLRRVKCDESRPACARCSKSKQRCSYLDEIPRLPASVSSTASTQNIAPARVSSPVSSPSASCASFQPFPIPIPVGNPSPSNHACSPRPHTLDERYGLLHLSLLHHFEHELVESIRSVHPGLDATIPLLTAEAFQAPYLMDQLLALAAAHKSTQAQETRLFYATEATRLQTRALNDINCLQPKVSADNCVPMFIFSSFVGQHALFDVSNAVHDDVGTMLEGLIHCIGLHRGIGIIGGSAWPLLRTRLWGDTLEACTGAGSQLGSEGFAHGDLDVLLQRIRDSGLNAPMTAANRDAALILQRCFSSLSPSSSPTSHWMAAVQEWLMIVPPDYVEYLRQRRQETLVVLAHYAVMLHYTSRYWYVEDLGARLVNLITRHLGSYWEPWLAWPNRVIREKHGDIQ